MAVQSRRGPKPGICKKIWRSRLVRAVCAQPKHSSANSLSSFGDDTTPSSCVSRLAKFKACQFQSGGGRLDGSRQCFGVSAAETLYLFDKRTHLRLCEFSLQSNDLCKILGLT